MSIPYKARKRTNPMDRSEALFYPCSTFYSEIGTEKICENISTSTSLSISDVQAVIRSLLDWIPNYLSEGHSVRLDNLGIFKLGISGTGEATAEAVGSDNITSTKILFLADTKLKAKFVNASFKKVDSSTSSSSSSSESTDSSSDSSESSSESSDSTEESTE